MRRTVLVLAVGLFAALAWPTVAGAQVWSQIDVCEATTEATGSSLNTATTCDVQADDVVFCAVFNAGNENSMSVTDSGQTQTFIPLALASLGTGTRLQIHYTLTPTVLGSVTYRANFGSSVIVRRIRCVVLRSSIGTPTIETSDVNIGSASTISSGSIAVTGSSDVAVYVFARAVNNLVQSNHEINGDTSVAASVLGGVYSWRLLNTSTFTDDATSTISSGTPWAAAYIAFQSEVAAPSGSTDCRNMLLLGVGGPCS